MRHLAFRTLAACGLLLIATTSASRAAAGALDEGRLQNAWFGAELPFRETDDVDYLWVKDGFSLDGRTFHFVPFAPPTLLGEDRDADDQALAREVSARFHRLLHDATTRAWSGRASASLEAGDVRVEGRVVDCSAGNDTAKVLIGFGAGAGSTTFDLKLIDAASGELLAALHTRVVSGTSWSTTDGKLAGWLDDWATAVAKRGFAQLYAKGDPVDE
jgi:hypothetical protein